MVRASSLLTGVQSGALGILAQACLAATAVLYLLCLRRLHIRGRRPPARRTVCFLAGLFALWVAVGSGLAGYDDTNVTAHVVQHLLLMMVAPPLLVLGRPVVVVLQAAGRSGQSRLARALASWPARVLTHPLLTWAVYLAAMALMLADRSVYQYLVQHPLTHDATHVAMLATGVLYWEPLLGGTARGRPVSQPVRVMSVLANMPFEVLIGLWLRYQVAPLGPSGTVADTQRAGEAFVVGATLLSTVWLGAIVWQWAAAALREEKRAASRTPAAEWTTPWWVEASEVNGVAGGP